MISNIQKIITAQFWLDLIQLDKWSKPSDFKLVTDYKPPFAITETKRFSAIVEIEYDEVGRPRGFEITFLGEEVEPEEEIPAWIESEEARSEGHSENERNEARIAALFGIKKYG